MKNLLGTEIKFYCAGNDEKCPDVENLLPLLEQSATNEPPGPKERDFYGILVFIKFNRLMISSSSIYTH